MSEVLVAKASEIDEDAGTARIVTRARKEIASGGHYSRKILSIVWPTERIRCGLCASGENITQMYLSFKTSLSQGYIRY